MRNHNLPNFERIEKIIDGWQEKQVVVLGDIMLDHYLWGVVDRISPEAPVPVVNVQRESHLLGGAANVALNLKKLGCNPLVIGVIGDDAAGSELRKILSITGIDGNGIETDQYRPTTIKTRVIANHQQVVRADREDATEIDDDLQRRFLGKLKDRIASISGLIISDYGKGMITKALLEQVISLCRENDVFIAVDPKDVHFKSYRKVSVITPNHHEAGFAFGMKIRDEATLNEVGAGLLIQLELDSILITRGADGMALFLNDGSKYLLPTVAQKVFDVTGAGDTVIATYSSALSGGATPFEAAYISNQAAGIVVGEIGTAQVEAEQLKETIAAHIEGQE
ncbi:MAG: D-glycero-beta-D-manno-heptose-7-phosphate kinase [candidate division Zixibacteria bacterium]|nr:D-glycero-beta-D-manno-heptose-7-phosphate kinase [candidate division Zixibacteria bacterium]MBU1469814.1 D-glycero-beta-D-manno-heptose-7-phosphate kinase [candidate division Zixibacteria bacterium]MBU2625360.1 D-glycero-beta-D-manno-heptose-7-phosphate kinase [candidate division Zixibacteria bacterium]